MPLQDWIPVRAQRYAALAWVLVLATARSTFAEDGLPTEETIRAAIAKSIPLLEAGAKGSAEQRKQCFTCHNQGLAVMALTTARSRGFEVDVAHLEAQARFTSDFLKKNKDRYLEGKGQGGQVDTAGYALWMLDIGGWQPDETTAAVAEYLLLYQRDQDYWSTGAHRPPSEASAFTTSYVALRGLKSFATPPQRDRCDARIARLKNWLRASPAEDTEDQVFRLRGLHLVAAASDEVQRAAQDLVDGQRCDGGWGQVAELASDPYATGSALVALAETGSLAVDDRRYRRGLDYLIDAQRDDGSWYVASRSKPFQTYFESGYPHGKDQFISIAAAGWATKALALSLPETRSDPSHRDSRTGR